MNPVLRIGADPFPPYQYYDENGVVCGIDCDTVTAAFQEAGYDIEIELLDWAFVQEKLDNGTFQAIFQVQPNPERLAKYCFSDLLRNAVTEVVSSREGLLLRGYQDIPAQNLTLGVLQGYTNGPEIDAIPASAKKEYPDNVSLLKAISAGCVDLGVFDRGVKAYLMEQQGITNIYSIDSMTYSRPLHVVFCDAALRDAFNSALEKVKK